MYTTQAKKKLNNFVKLITHKTMSTCLAGNAVLIIYISSVITMSMSGYIISSYLYSYIIYFSYISNEFNIKNHTCVIDSQMPVHV